MFENNDKIDCVNNVVILKETDWLFLAQSGTAQRQMEHFLGELTVSDDVIDNFNLNIKRNKRFCENNGFPYLHVVFPAKPIVMKEMFLSQGVKLNSIYTDKHISDSVIYPLPTIDPMLSMEKYGTHNTSYGYWDIVKQVFSKLGVDIPEDITFKRVDVNDGGLARKLGKKMPNHSELFIDDCFSYSIVEYSNSDALVGNTGKLIFKYNSSAPIKKRILLFGDSFFVGASQIMANIFEEVIFLRNPFILEDVSQCLSPDIILTGNAERYLVNTPNSSSSAPWFLRFFNSRFNSTLLSQDFITACDALFSGRYSTKYFSWKVKAVKENAIKHRDKGNLDAAASILTKSDGLISKSWVLLFELAKIYRRMGRLDDAIVYSYKSLELSNSNLTIMEFIGDIYYEIGVLSKAVSQYENVLNIDSNRGLTLFKLSRVYYRNKLYSKAYTIIKKAIGLQPHKGSYHELLGDICSALSSHQESLESYEIAYNILGSNRIKIKMCD